MPIRIGEVDIKIDPRDPSSALRATIARLEARIAQLESAISVEADGSVTVQSSGRLKIASLRGVEIATPSASIKVEAGNIRVAAPTFTLAAGSASLESPIVAASGLVRCSTMQCDTVIAATYTPGAGNIW